MASEAYSRHLIRMARRDAGLSQTELARRAKTSQAAISAYESGKRSPSVETLSRVLTAAGFELRMRLAVPDSHDAARKVAESLLPPADLQAFTERERRRASRARTGSSRATARA
jgi:transcriptional regulator with XRE-family HTH domain